MKKTKKINKLKKDETFDKKQVAGMILSVYECIEGLLVAQMAMQEQINLLSKRLDGGSASTAAPSRNYVWSLSGEKLG
jgi:hypothetical protein